MEHNREVTIIMTAHNQVELVKVNLSLLKKIGLLYPMKIIIVNNASEDGLWDFLEQEKQVISVYCEDGMEAYGHIINQVISTFEIEEDFLLLDPNILLTEHTLKYMMKTLYREEETAVVGPDGNGFFYWESYRCEMWNCKNFQEFVKKADAMNVNQWEPQMLHIKAGAVLIKNTIFKQVGGFSEQLFTKEMALLDFELRIMTNGGVMRLCEDAAVYDIWKGNRKAEPELAVYEEQDRSFLEKAWGMHYFNMSGNNHIVRMMEETTHPEAVIDILEVGCDCGATLLEIKNRFKNAKVYGYELNAPSVRIAKTVAKVKVGNIEEKNITFGVKYDYIIFGDVLEHLHDPMDILLYCRSLLKENGKIVASIPNLMHISVMKQLLNGTFSYTDSGLLDRTHIHFFTYAEIVKMFTQAGYELEMVNMVKGNEADGDVRLIENLCSLSEQTQPFMYEAFQYLVVARSISL